MSVAPENFDPPDRSVVENTPENQARIGGSIHLLRLDKNWTQHGLAQKAGIKVRDIAKIESLEFDLEAHHSAIIAICKALETSVPGLIECSEREFLPRDEKAALEKLGKLLDSPS